MTVPVAMGRCHQSSPRQNPQPSTGFSCLRMVVGSRRWLRTRAGVHRRCWKGGGSRFCTGGELEFAGCRFCPNRLPRRCLIEILRRRALAGDQVQLQSRKVAEASLAAKDPTVSWPVLAAAGLTSSSLVKSFGASSRQLVAFGFLRSSEEVEGEAGHPSAATEGGGTHPSS